jgi:hypothetical protein
VFESPHRYSPIRVLYRSAQSMLVTLNKAHKLFTGMAQRQRAGLITPRSLDRNGLPVFSYSCALQKRIVNALVTLNLCNTLFTGMAQRQRAGLITPRSLDRNGLPVFPLASFTEIGRLAGR